MALDIPKMWARRMEAEMKDWEEPFPGFFRRYFRNLWLALRGEGL